MIDERHSSADQAFRHRRAWIAGGGEKDHLHVIEAGASNGLAPHEKQDIST